MTEQKAEKEVRHCPYCDEEVMSADLPWCQACHVKAFHCHACKKPISREEKVCPDCGAEIES
ncbi:hypothetical protein ACFLYX_00255 [Chloroflexota bacterium]